MKEIVFKSKKGWMCKKTILEVNDSVKLDKNVSGRIIERNQNTVKVEAIFWDNLNDSGVRKILDLEITTTTSFGNALWNDRGIIKNALEIKEIVKY